VGRRIDERCRYRTASPDGAWYAKPLPTFSDAIAAVRWALWCPMELFMSRPGQATVEIPITLLQRLVDTVGYAA
jgi:hypothetical protein